MADTGFSRRLAFSWSITQALFDSILCRQFKDWLRPSVRHGADDSTVDRSLFTEVVGNEQPSGCFGRDIPGLFCGRDSVFIESNPFDEFVWFVDYCIDDNRFARRSFNSVRKMLLLK